MAKKILIVVSAKHASGYYRMVQAGNLLENMGYKVNYTKCVEDGIGIDWDIIEQDYDTAIFQYGFSNKIAAMIDKFNRAGTYTVLETDDDYYHIPASNKSFWQLHPKMICYNVLDKPHGVPIKEIYIQHLEHQINFTIDNFKRAASIASMLQVSTPELAEYYSSLNDNIVVLENCIDNRLYDCVKKEKHDDIVMGWFGTPTHYMDLRFIIGAIPDNVTFLTYGHTDLNKQVFNSADNIISNGYYDLFDLPKIIAKMDFGVVPLEENKFNNGKSDLKGLEFAAMSLPVIASPVAPYKRFIRHNVNGLLVKNNNGKEWVKAIKLLANDKDLRDRLGNEAKKDAIKRDIRNNINDWVKAWRLE